jgi:uncharacterized protein involved in outer membrane biogenesis
VLSAVLTLVVAPIVLGLLIVLVLANTPWGNERVRRIIVSQADKRLSGELHIGALRGNLLSNATLSNVRITDSLRQPVFSAKRVRVEYALWSALRGHVVIRSLTIDTAVVVMDKRPGSRWNFQALLPPRTTTGDTSSHGPPPSLANVIVRHTDVVVRQPWRPDSTLAPATR